MPKKQASSKKASSYDTLKLYRLLVSILIIGIFVIAKYYFELSFLQSYLTAINLVVFLIVAYDKTIAASSATRIPEVLFYILALVGASLGLLVSMILFRHKTAKTSFQITLALILIVQIVLLKFVIT